MFVHRASPAEVSSTKEQPSTFLLRKKQPGQSKQPRAFKEQPRVLQERQAHVRIQPTLGEGRSSPFQASLGKAQYMKDMDADRMSLTLQLVRSVRQWGKLIKSGPPREISLRCEK